MTDLEAARRGGHDAFDRARRRAPGPPCTPTGTACSGRFCLPGRVTSPEHVEKEGLRRRDYSGAEQVTVHVDDGWATVSVVVRGLRPGDIIEQLERQGHPDLAASLAASVIRHGIREGLRRVGVSYR